MNDNISDEANRQYNERVIKANRALILKNEQGKTGPRWFAAIRHIKEAIIIARLNGADTTKAEQKLQEAQEYLDRNCL